MTEPLLIIGEPEQAIRGINEVWKDPDWGTFRWLATLHGECGVSASIMVGWSKSWAPG